MSTLAERIAADTGRLLKNLPGTVEARFTANGSTTSKSIKVVFCAPYSQTDLFDGGTTNTAPVVFVAESEVENPEKGDTYKIDTVTYYSQKVVPHGIGLNVVTLSKQATHG